MRTKTSIVTVEAFARSCLIFPGVVALIAAIASPVRAEEQSARLNATVEPRQAHTTRLGNLPEGAMLAIRVETDGEIGVLLLDHEGFAAFPDADEALFEGRTTDRLRFSLRIRDAGDYYLVIDNRAGSATRGFTLAVTASSAAPSAGEARAKLERAYAELEEFEETLRRVFVFDALDFKIGRCGTANAFSGGDTVYICTEIGPRLMRDIGDERKARDALVFAMLHEIGHVLLKQWRYPFYDNEEVADEFATVLMVMFGQGERARTQAEYFSALSPDAELERKRERDDRHPLSVQRARNIVRWLEDPELVRRWQRVLVPHMQTRILRALEAAPKEWTDLALVKQELAKRGAD